MEGETMSKLAWMIAVVGFVGAPVLAQTPAQGSIPDLRGTWKGQSESVVFGAGNHPHHGSHQEGMTRFTSQPFTMIIDKQDGRRFSGTFSSGRHTETIIGVIPRDGRIVMVDDDGYSFGTLLAPSRLEGCYAHLPAGARVASCTEFTKQ
jgi:hypothetical protein